MIAKIKGQKPTLSYWWQYDPQSRNIHNQKTNDDSQRKWVKKTNLIVPHRLDDQLHAAGEHNHTGALRGKLSARWRHNTISAE
jgi:hypothetical protein